MSRVAIASAAMLLAAALGACDPDRPAQAPPALAEVCSAAMPGTACDLAVSGGDSPVVSHCTKQHDGSLVCDSPDLRAEGPSPHDLRAP